VIKSKYKSCLNTSGLSRDNLDLPEVSVKGSKNTRFTSVTIVLIPKEARMSHYGHQDGHGIQPKLTLPTSPLLIGTKDGRVPASLIMQFEEGQDTDWLRLNGYWRY